MPTRSDHDSSLGIPLGQAEFLGDVSSPELPVVDLSSKDPLPEKLLAGDAAATEAASASSRVDPADRPSGSLWLSGDVLMCACPDCQAPMSVRLWLMVADCWHCGTSIELTEEQEREARRLLEQRDAQRQQGESASSSAARPTVPPGQTAPGDSAPRARDAARPDPQPRPQPAPQERTPDPGDRQPPRQRPTGRPDPRVSRRRPASRPARRKRGVSSRIGNLLAHMPAWLVSLVFHLILLTLLGLLKVGDDQHGPYITLSTTVSKDVREGGNRVSVDPEDELAFDLPIPQDVDLQDRQLREAIVRADQDARQLRLDPDIDHPHLPDLQIVKDALRRDGAPAPLVGRDPRIRVEMVQREGGTTLTEAAVARGLHWLAKHQAADGHWSLHGFNHTAGCTCGGSGIRSDSAGTSLALLPFLGAGQTHLVGRYRSTVSKGLRWLLENQKPDGDLRAGAPRNAGMYAHGQGAIVLCEAFLMTGDEAFRIPAQRAIDFIVEAQHPRGGWRYTPGEEGDTSVLGWQLMALQSARAANLTVPDETLELASHYLDSVEFHGGSQYAYRPHQQPTPPMTAEALLCRLYLGWNANTPGLEDGMRYLVDEHLPDSRRPNVYYWYYATQALHHFGGSQWDSWNQQMREILVKSQRRRGHTAGSWDPAGPHASAGGRIYMTSLAVCSLEVYYRHLPIFRRLELEE